MGIRLDVLGFYIGLLLSGGVAPASAQAQAPAPTDGLHYRNLVMEDDDIRGIAYGRTLELEQQDVLRGNPPPDQPAQVLVDGGRLANYPIDLFGKPRYFPTGPTAMPDARNNVFNPQNPGPAPRPRRANYAGQRPHWPPTARTLRHHRTEFNSYARALYTLALENFNPVQPTHWQRTVSINFLNFSPKIKRISDVQKQ